MKMCRISENHFEFWHGAAWFAASVVHTSEPIMTIRNQSSIALSICIGECTPHDVDMLFARGELRRSSPFEADFNTSTCSRWVPGAISKQVDGSGEMIARRIKCEGSDRAVPCLLKIP